MVIDYMFLIVGGFAAFLVAWVNGANNAANAIGSAVGSGMMSIRKALWFTALFDLLGALFFGKFVSITLLRGIVNISIIDDPLIVVIGMITALFSTGLWLIITTLLKIPMSISQAIVGAILGFGLVTVGFSQINWSKVFEIIASWIYLPFVSIVLSIILYRIHSRIVSKPSYLRFIIVYNVFTTCILFTT
ncbi:MAG: inorganic phosphate transporter, partial [Desulfurococcaceae archaeon]